MIEKVKIEPDNEIEDRRKQFFQMVALAIAKAVKKGRHPETSRSEARGTLGSEGAKCFICYLHINKERGVTQCRVVARIYIKLPDV